MATDAMMAASEHRQVIYKSLESFDVGTSITRTLGAWQTDIYRKQPRYLVYNLCIVSELIVDLSPLFPNVESFASHKPDEYDKVFCLLKSLLSESSDMLHRT